MDIKVSESKICCRLDDNPPNQHVMVILNFVIEMVHLKHTHIQFFPAGREWEGEGISPDPPTMLGAKLPVPSELGMFLVPLLIYLELPLLLDTKVGPQHTLDMNVGYLPILMN